MKITVTPTCYVEIRQSCHRNFWFVVRNRTDEPATYLTKRWQLKATDKLGWTVDPAKIHRFATKEEALKEYERTGA